MSMSPRAADHSDDEDADVDDRVQASEKLRAHTALYRTC